MKIFSENLHFIHNIKELVMISILLYIYCPLTIIFLYNDILECDLRDVDISDLASHFEDIQSLEKLNLSSIYLYYFIYLLMYIDNKIGDYGVRCICENIDELTKLQDLHLENNEIGDRGAESLIENLEKYKNSRWLYIHHNKISNYDEFIQKMRDTYPDKRIKVM